MELSDDSGITKLKHADLIVVSIFSGIARPEAIAETLTRLGVPITVSTVRARLSEMIRGGLIVGPNPKITWYGLTVPRGEDYATGITKQISDEELGQFVRQASGLR